MHDTYPALGLDPAPCDVAATGELLLALQRSRRTLARIRTALASFDDVGSQWRGEAAAAFAGALGELPDYLARAEASHHEAHLALSGWLDDVERRQHVARRLERQALAAERVLAAHPPDGPRPLAAEGELGDLRRRALRLAQEHDEQAARVATALRAAADHAPVQPDAFARLGSALLGGLALAAASPTWAWGQLEAHAHVIAELADVLADASVLLGFVAFLIPPPACFAVVGAAALLTLGTRALADAAGASVPGSTYVLDGLSIGTAAVSGVAAVGVRHAGAALAGYEAAGYGGGAAAAREAMAHYGRLQSSSSSVGTGGSLAGTGAGIHQSEGKDRPFLHFVPDNAGEAALGVTSIGGLAFLNAVQLGMEKDRAAAAEAERARWTR